MTRLNQFDLNKLRVLSLVETSGSVKGAAKILKVSPPAVSQALRQLEELSPTKLHFWSAKSFQLTSEGQKLIAICERFFADLSAWEATLDHRNLLPPSKVTIGAPLEFGSTYLVQAVAKWKEKHPVVKVQVNLGMPNRILSAMERKELDFAFVDDGPFDSRFLNILQFKTFVTQKLSLVAKPALVRDLAEGDEAKLLAKLTELPHIAYLKSKPALNQWYKHHFDLIPKCLHLAMITEHADGIKQAALAGLGLGCLPAQVVKREINEGKLTEIFGKKEPCVHKIWLCLHPDQSLSSWQIEWLQAVVNTCKRDFLETPFQSALMTD